MKKKQNKRIILHKNLTTIEKWEVANLEWRNKKKSRKGTKKTRCQKERLKEEKVGV
jgi:hypothetical protein